MTEEYVQRWAMDQLRRTPMSFRCSVHAGGTHDKHAGPAWQYASLELAAEPSNAFSVVVECGEGAARTARENGWLDAAVFGVLDVFMTSRSVPVLGVLIRIKAIKDHPVDSSQIAFRLAGRQAAQKLLELENANWV